MMKSSSRAIVQGLSILIISLILIMLLTDSGAFVFVKLTATSIACGGLIIIISGLFELRQQYNTSLYLAISGAILAISLVLIYIQFSVLTSQYNQILYAVIIGTLIANFAFMYSFAQRLQTHGTIMELYDKALEIYPQDTTSLNNKGTALSDIKEYRPSAKMLR